MNTLLALRHAKSSWNNPALSDHERPLNKRGRQAAPRMGQLLIDEDLVPQLVLCSTARRAQETAELLFELPAFDSRMISLDELYLAPPRAYLQVLAAHVRDESCVLIIGHNPGIENLVRKLTGQSPAMPTAALARIEVEDWSELPTVARGRLVDHWIPRELD